MKTTPLNNYGDLLAFLQGLTPEQLEQPILAFPDEQPPLNSFSIIVDSERWFITGESLEPESACKDDEGFEDYEEYLPAGRVIMFVCTEKELTAVEIAIQVATSLKEEHYAPSVNYLAASNYSDEALQELLADITEGPTNDLLMLLKQYTPERRRFLAENTPEQVEAYFNTPDDEE